jgi:hypothetical protein
MDVSIFKFAAGVAGLAGLIIGSVTILFREFLKKKFLSNLTKKQTFLILVIFLIIVWSIAITGIYGYFWVEKVERTPSVREKIVVLMELGPRILKEKKKQDRAFFEDFVKPFFENFENVHKTYKDSFKKYQEMIDDKKIKLDNTHPVFAEIKKDMLFTADQRRNLGNMAEAIFSTEGDATASNSLNYNLEALVAQVYMYIECIDALGKDLTEMDIPVELKAGDNCIRVIIDNSLTRIFSSTASREEKYEEASNEINKAVSILQKSYIQTAEYYYRVKADLLSTYS